MKLRIIISMIFLPLAATSTSHGYDLALLKEKAFKSHDRATYSSLVEIEKLLSSLKQSNTTEKLMGINDYFNQKIEYKLDIDVWGISDYWSTPMELMTKLAGDCEDYSIAKFVFLMELGIPEDKLRLFYVKANPSEFTQKPKAHLILAYYDSPTADPLILDNMTSEIVRANDRPDLIPVFSFNTKDLWIANSTSPIADSKKHLSKWREVVSKVERNQ